MNLRLMASVFLLLPVVACTVFSEYPIEVYKPGEINIPSSVSNVAIGSRNFKFTGDTLLNYLKNGSQVVKAANDPGNLDSLLISVCLNELAAKLKNNATFTNVKVLPYHSFETHIGENIPELPSDLVKQITQATGTDLLIVLETLSTFYTSYPETTDSTFTNSVVTAAIWGIYDPADSIPTERKSMTDTFFWNGNSSEIPSRLESLQLASSVTGENFAKNFYAGWHTENRIYSVPPLPEFSKAAYYFEEGKWDYAISIWEKYSDSGNGKMAINARYNLALAFEMKDDLITAQKWLDAALALAKKYRSKTDIYLITEYNNILKARIRDLKKLNE